MLATGPDELAQIAGGDTLTWRLYWIPRSSGLLVVHGLGASALRDSQEQV